MYVAQTIEAAGQLVEEYRYEPEPGVITIEFEPEQDCLPPTFVPTNLVYLKHQVEECALSGKVPQEELFQYRVVGLQLTEEFQWLIGIRSTAVGNEVQWVEEQDLIHSWEVELNYSPSQIYFEEF